MQAMVRVFDPNFAAAHANPALLDRMSVITPLNALNMLDGMKQELPLYLAAAAASAPAFDKGSVADYTEAILKWWRTNGSSFKAWALAARVVFAISPNSASCERVFALLKRLFGEQQMSSLAVSALRAPRARARSAPSQKSRSNPHFWCFGRFSDQKRDEFLVAACTAAPAWPTCASAPAPQAFASHCGRTPPPFGWRVSGTARACSLRRSSMPMARRSSSPRMSSIFLSGPAIAITYETLANTCA